MPAERRQAVLRVERRIGRVQHVGRRMVDVEQDRVEAARRMVRVEAGFRRSRHREKIAMDEAAARIRRQQLAERQEALLVPFDDRLHGVDHQHRGDLRVLERGGGGVAEPQPADHDLQFGQIEFIERQAGKSLFRSRELRRHEEVVIELDLVDVAALGKVLPAPQHERAERCHLVVQFLEKPAHECIRF